MGLDPQSPGDAASAPFRRAVIGIDGSGSSIEAARQARALAAPDAELVGVAVWEPGAAALAGIHAAEVAADLRRAALVALDRAQAEVEGLEPVLLRGGPVAGLLSAAAERDADLLAVGAHGTSRAAGIVFGSVATGLAHHAGCTTLIARGVSDFPGTILHANDGSAEGLAAARVAGQIAAMHETSVVTVHVAEPGSAGPGAAEAAGALIAESGREPVVEVLEGSPHRELVAYATEARAGLVVIGSRGRTGIRALGSVSERVAHRAPCSVLIVRHTQHPGRDVVEENATARD